MLPCCHPCGRAGHELRTTPPSVAPRSHHSSPMSPSAEHGEDHPAQGHRITNVLGWEGPAGAQEEFGQHSETCFDCLLEPGWLQQVPVPLVLGPQS